MADQTRRPLDDAALAAAFRGARRASGDHLSESRWEQLACDEMTPADRDAALAHIMSCDQCSTIHRSLMDLRQGAAEIDGLAPAARAGEGQSPISRRQRWALFGGLAAAAVLMLAIFVDQPARRSADTDPTRSDRATGVVRVIAPAADAVLSDRRFSWSAVPGADAYELRVHTSDGGRVFTSRRDEPSAELPAEIAMPRGAYYWQVTAFKDGAAVASSPLVPFRVN